MTIEVDVKKLVKNLKNAEKAEDAGLSEGVRYLLKQVYRTLIMNEPLTVGDIDFSRFTYEDIEDFADHLSVEMNEKTGKAERVFDLFTKCRPKTITRRAFF